jgi:hypothetical protein
MAIALISVSVSMPVHATRYQHHSGIGFNYPSDWSLQEQGEVVVLRPGKAKPLSRNELLVVGAEPLAETTDLASPAIVQWFDQQMTALVGAVERQGGPKSVQSGVALSYASKDGRLHRVRYRRLGGLGVYVAHVGVTKRHDRAASMVFHSLGGKLALDRQLVGSWYRSASSSTGVTYNASGASYVNSNARYRYTFAADNRVAFQSGVNISGQGSASGGTTSVSSGGDNKPHLGSYAANGKKLSIIWNDGDSAELDYKIFADNKGHPVLKLINPDTGKHKFYHRVN